MNYEQTVRFLYAQLPMYQRDGAPALKFDLGNTKKLLSCLSNPHDKVKTIHVAGTNGKGSSSHMLASVLQASGYKTGLYTSPHLRSFSERIRINGGEVDPRFVVDFVERIKADIARIQPSFFEITFVMAMAYFEEQQVDIAVIEVGMGGRFDSTNVIKPEVSLITNIALDHQYFLGDSLEDIAVEKAGIMKKGIQTIVGKRQNETTDVFTSISRKKGAMVNWADEFVVLEQAASNRYNVIYRNELVLEGLQTDLKGPYQPDNLPAVLAVSLILREKGWKAITDQSIEQGLAHVVRNTGLKGRWQQLGKAPVVIADTGHNEEGIRITMQALRGMKYDQLHIVWGMVDDKDVSNILRLLPKKAKYYFVSPNIPRAMPIADLMASARSAGLDGHIFDSVMQGVIAAKNEARVDDVVFIGGSTFVVAEIENL